MFRFQYIEILWGLLFIVAVLIVSRFLYLKWRKKAIINFGELELVERLISGISKQRLAFKFILFLLGISFLMLAMANLQFGTKEQEAKREGVDLIIALDVSNSMLAEDLYPNRLEASKRAIEQLIHNLHNDRLGIIVFAGDAYVQLPITTDYAAAKLFLNTINTDIIQTQGTSIGAAINLAIKSFDYKNGTSKSIIVITDGESHEDDGISAAKNATDKGITVHTIGMGSQKGVPIPVYKNGNQIGFKQDRSGTTVITRLNEQMLKEISDAGDGIYVRASNSNVGLNVILDEIDKMEKKEYGTKSFKSYEDRFQIFLAISLLLLLIEFFLSGKKSAILSKIKLFETK